MAPRFENLSANQTRVLGELAIGNDAGHSRNTLDSLVKAGYAERCEERRGAYVTVFRYAVPIAVHMRWCAWCATLPDEE